MIPISAKVLTAVSFGVRVATVASFHCFAFLISFVPLLLVVHTIP